MRDKFIFVPGVGLSPRNTNRAAGIAQVFGDTKARQKAFSNQLNTRYLQDLATWQANPGGMTAHPILWNYEKDYLNSGGNWGRLKKLLLIRYRGSIQFQSLPAVGEERIYSTDAAPELLGTVYLSGSRFIPLAPQPVGVVNTVYVRRNKPPRHYVLLPTSGTYARRFVTRGLNASDGMNYTNGQPLEAPHYDPAHPDQVIQGETQADSANRHPVVFAPATNLTENQQIMSHARGWKKRYISTGISNRPAISTRGVQFVSMYGTAVIDLAKVNLNTVFDLHRPDTAQQFMGLAATHVVTAANHGHPGGSYAAEQFLGLRDILRTRELLIKGSVPVAALCANSQGARLVGVYSSTNGLHNQVTGIVARLPALVRTSILQTDSLTFRINNFKWHFYAFGSALHANWFVTAIAPSLTLMPPPPLAPAPGHGIVQFNKYQHTQPLGMI